MRPSRWPILNELQPALDHDTPLRFLSFAGTKLNGLGQIDCVDDRVAIRIAIHGKQTNVGVIQGEAIQDGGIMCANLKFPALPDGINR